MIHEKGHETSTIAVCSQISKSHGAEIGRKNPKSLSAKYLKNYPTNFSQTRQTHIMIDAHCVQQFGCNKSKVRVTRHEADISFGSLAEASFWSPLGRVVVLLHVVIPDVFVLTTEIFMPSQAVRGAGYHYVPLSRWPAQGGRVHFTHTVAEASYGRDSMLTS